MASDSDSGRDSGEADQETEWLFPSDSRSEPATQGDRSASTDTPADADRVTAFDEAAFGAENSGAFRTDPVTEPAPTRSPFQPPERPSERTREPRRSRKRLLVVAAVVVLLIVVAGVGVVAAMRRDGGAKSSSGAVRSHGSTSTTSRAQVTTTVAPAVTSVAPSTSPATPAAFTVRASCAGRDCAVAVREAPSASARQVTSLRTGQVVQINCSTHGDAIDDRDTGRRSDVWYRFADTGGYSSALYLDGPTVPDCG